MTDHENCMLGQLDHACNNKDVLNPLSFNRTKITLLISQFGGDLEALRHSFPTEIQGS